ncbi:MAG: Riboflavin biosynthesis protein RibF [Firmicutes bacterium ADurb.Bin182]|nr:MAG: Riboflavin biosynthesis protein RibF [Firmicutes bacterium ADurb.Bin182]
MINNTSKRGAVVSLGMFDGVHMGHRALLNTSLNIARENDLESIVYTFIDHPMKVLGKSPKLLMTFKERFDSMKALGLDKVDAVHFDRELASMEPLDFIKMLLSRYPVKFIVAGFNYSFGRYGTGDCDCLTRFGRELGIGVQIIPPVIYNGSSVSSTRIRESLENGQLEEANKMLQSRYTLSGKVVSNRRIGTRIGFPTANITPPQEKMLPRSGVYAAVAHVENGTHYYAVTNIGKNPTFQGSHTTIESHLIDFSGDIYDKHMSIALYRRIRDEIKFPDAEALARQISKDKNTVQQYFNMVN